MAKCDLEIELEDGRRRWGAGETVRGRVWVDVNDTCRCKDLALHMGWSADGWGTDEESTVLTKSLFVGEWTAGQRHSYPFEMEIPAVGPTSFAGRLFHLDWWLEAEADIPWAFDPKHEVEFEVGSSLYNQNPPDAGTEEPMEKDAGWSATGLVFSLFSLAAFGFAWLASPWNPAGSGSELMGIPWPLFSGILTAFGVLFGYLAIRSVLAEKVLGKLGVFLSPPEPFLGRELQVRLTFTPTQDVRIESIDLTLTCYEDAKRHRRKELDESKTERVYEDVVRAWSAQEVAAGQAQEVVCRLPIPEDLPVDFSAEYRKVFWLLKVHVGIDGHSDWEKTYSIDVRP